MSPRVPKGANLMANERRDNSARNLTLIGMMLTVVISIGGAWKANDITTSVNTSQIQSLQEAVKISEQVDTRVYRLEAKVDSLESKQNSTNGDVDILEVRVNSVEINNARTAQAIENLVTATNNLTETTNKLMVTVAKIEDE